MPEQKRLIQLKTGESGKVVSFMGGMEFQRRLETLGIRIGSRITKISSHFWQGPVTVRVNQCSVALGHGMASKIVVETE
jgi:ferrous iron transport protein A